jgi:hypothetical protein
MIKERFTNKDSKPNWKLDETEMRKFFTKA